MSLYWQSMRLAYDPFMAEQANQTPFISPKWEQQLDLLVHLATSQDSMLLVLGVSGIGKSTMMRQFIENLGHSGGICKIHGGATITTDVLQDLIARHLGFTWSQQDPEQFSSQLLERMGRMRAEGHDFYLVIDNAHKLPKASLALLLELVEIQGGDQHPIHIVLFGGPQLEALIGDITSQHLGEVLTHSIQLEPLNLEYLKNYVEQRLNLAGFNDALPFSQNQLQQIYQISGGIPAKVNSLARQLLLQWSQQGNKKSSDKRASVTRAASGRRKPLSIYWYGGAGFAVIAVVLLIMFYFNTPNADAVGNQTLMVNASKDTSQDYDEAGSEATPKLSNQQANATATAAAVPDSSYTEVDSDGNSTATVNQASATQADAQTDSGDNAAASSANSASASSSSGGAGTASSSAGAATSSDGMVNSDDDNASADNSAMAVPSQTSQTVNQALADNAALAKQPATATHGAVAMGLAPTSAAQPAAVANQSHAMAAPEANTSLVTSNASATVAAKAPQSSSDAEYIPSGSQIPVDAAASAAATSTPKTPVTPTDAMTAMPKQTLSQTEAQTLAPHSASKASAAKTSAKPAKANVKQANANSMRAVLDAAYFKAQPASHVALQIAASRDFSKLKQQVASYHLQNPVHYFKTTMNGGPWYVATYGSYPSTAVAANAKSNLPAAVLATKPWPRSYQSIQAAINIG